MKVDGTSQLTLSVVLLSMILLCPDVSAQSQTPQANLAGDWNVKLEINGRKWDTILSFSTDEGGKTIGRWISLLGADELSDIAYEDGALSFLHSRRNRDGETVTSKFTGSIRDGNLTGSLASDRGSFRAEGSRSQRVPNIAGSWETKFKIGDREITNTLVITTGKDGKLAVDWRSERVESKITEIHHKRNKLTFKTHGKLGDREWDSTFDGAFENDTYAGVIKSKRGEIAVQGKRIGAPLVGTWNLDVSSERSGLKQRLQVLPDMSGFLGATRVEKIELRDGNVSFKISLQFGDRTHEIEFKGNVDGDGLTGEIISERGTRKVTGKKIKPRRVARRTRAF